MADPTPAADGAVIRVEATGLCRSDWHGWRGHDPDIKQFPHVPGHEFAGTVVEVGRDVKRPLVGEHVTMPFVAGCGTCRECQRGNPQICDRQFQPGFTAWGTFAEYVAVRYADGNLVLLPGIISTVRRRSHGLPIRHRLPRRERSRQSQTGRVVGNPRLRRIRAIRRNDRTAL